MRRRHSVSLLTRLPVPGAVKTRVAARLGDEAAASLHAAMTEHAARQLRLLRATDGVRAQVRVTGGSAAAAGRWLRLPARDQGGGDLGERQLRALREALGSSRVAAVAGSDCPGLDAEDVRRALAAASARGASLVPAHDGGYCLLAVDREAAAVLPAAFADVAWGMGDVAETLLGGLRHHGVDAEVLETRADVDRPEDVASWEAVRAAWYEPPGSLAVVVPTLDEATVLPALLERLLAEDVEVVVADGGSTDGTPAIAEAGGARVVRAAHGRGAQMNAGAEAAGGDALLFLHADTLPPRGFARLVLDALADPGLLVGAFRFSLAARRPALRVIETFTRLRGSLLHFPYGDQGLFCRRALWRALGRFPAYPLMEDYEFVRRARRAGLVRVLRADAVTSDRGWSEHGPWRWTALNVATTARYRLGTPPERLAAWRERGGRASPHSKR
ncbi:MAG: TIGR04283 family arsenosugar biosynthesis glycosyltransferase [Coriobacteriia bacterium]|nr:TIGR04283 family arsenosugar biosynthesis glycosyltransferase [Coriobacteriia bacterium]